MNDYLDRNILVVGTVRNCAHAIEKEYRQIAGALHRYKNVRYLIIESDSTDKTIAKLEQLKGMNPHFDYISLGELRTQIPKRTERIAFCRNRYLEEIENNKLYQDIQYVIVTDLDGTNTLLQEAHIESCWKRDDWDVCAANQKGPYYDIWAFRHPVHSPDDCLQYYQRLLTTEKKSPLEARRLAIFSRMITIPQSDTWLEVDSAFGGMAIYKKESLVKARYLGIDEKGNEVCEHVALHKQIKDMGGKIYINPNLINCRAPLEHVKLLSFKYFISWCVHQGIQLPQGQLFERIKSFWIRPKYTVKLNSVPVKRYDKQ
ncbi:MAG: hypothetical protein CMC08_10100 [Flavobacteriaceae bacterium]|nr:hypothetical protein [Flavobacteriaceae bacterium]